MWKKTTRMEGFTLIELMVVVAIMGIILAIAVPYFISYKRTACDRAVAANISEVSACLERFGNELVDLNCTDYAPSAANISLLVGPYYGWKGSQRKCEVRVMVDAGSPITEIWGCAINGSHPGGPTTRYLYRSRIAGGTDLPVSQTSTCHDGSVYGGRGNSCYTESMIDASCNFIANPGAIDCGQLTEE